VFKGFNRWQARVALLSALGVGAALLGVSISWYPLAVIGLAGTILCLPLLILLGSRQATRELRKIYREVTAYKLKQPSTTKPIVPRARQLPTPGVSHEYARRIQKRPVHFETFALMNKSTSIRDAFALAATQFQLRDRELSQFIAIRKMDMLPNITAADVKSWSAPTFLALARLKANQRVNDFDLEEAIGMFAFAKKMFGAKSLKQSDRLIYLEALGELSLFDKQLELATEFRIEHELPLQYGMLRLNTLDLSVTNNSKEWLNGLNKIYTDRGFSTVTLSEVDDSLMPIDRLDSQPSVLEEGPKVSVIVPTFKGGPSLFTALKSLLNQTWVNLEIIVVDDGSGFKYERYLSQAESLSSKIKVLRLPTNQGAYAARNAGAALATGEYVTVHDDDDWSHSEKISTQVRHLINNPEVPGNLSTHTRVTENLKFLRINNNPILAQANYSSLMVRKSMFDYIGYWDPVNRGADSEFRARIRKFFDEPVKTLETVPLSFTRTREGSLTSGELSRGFLDPARVLYSKAYQQWHASVGDDLSLLKPTKPRQYPVPTTMETGTRGEYLGDFDVVFVTDFKFPGGTSSLTLEEIKASADAGYRVGYIQLDSPLNTAKAPIQQHLFELQLNGKVQQLGLQDRASVKLLVVRHPSVATFIERQTSQLRVQKAVLIVNNPPILPNAQGMVFDLHTSLQNLDSLFAVKTQLIAESIVTQQLCHGLVPAERLQTWTWPGLVNPRGQVGTARDFTRTPVVGRHSRDDELKWPSSITDFNDAYSSTYFRTKFLGGIKSLTKKLGKEAISKKETYGFGEVKVDEFLDSIDFWVYFHDPRLTESFGMAIAEALAVGKVVVLPHYLRENFGDGAIYAHPNEVESIVMQFWSNPQDYVDQSTRARRFVENNFSNQAFLQRVQPLIEGASAPLQYDQ